VIILTRLGNGMKIAVNPDLIERVESTPDSVVTLVDGHKLVVEEPLTDMVELVREWRASVAARAITLACADEADQSVQDLDTDRFITASAVDAAAHNSVMQARVLRMPTRES
jgi:flagellar protein FlbD